MFIWKIGTCSAWSLSQSQSNFCFLLQSGNPSPCRTTARNPKELLAKEGSNLLQAMKNPHDLLVRLMLSVPINRTVVSVRDNAQEILGSSGKHLRGAICLCLNFFIFWRGWQFYGCVTLVLREWEKFFSQQPARGRGQEKGEEDPLLASQRTDLLHNARQFVTRPPSIYKFNWTRPFCSTSLQRSMLESV